ncbi:Uncharacterized protein dnm_010960 [Desulfonema magnum]|uniref:Uncharacterized protein n=1 Tax=Desulfonema magnum TaxID=45655 RepID=A0A975GKW0_9BACT|nr:Uncharacterized protein dnm_010960 [Desulfonema magnum]
MENLHSLVPLVPLVSLVSTLCVGMPSGCFVSRTSRGIRTRSVGTRSPNVYLIML